MNEMTSGHPRLPGSGLVWGLTIFTFMIVISSSGIIYATMGGRSRTNALAVVIAVELILAIAIGLYLRSRSR
jgi:hypothetical protein